MFSVFCKSEKNLKIANKMHPSLLETPFIIYFVHFELNIMSITEAKGNKIGSSSKYFQNLISITTSTFRKMGNVL